MGERAELESSKNGDDDWNSYWIRRLSNPVTMHRKRVGVVGFGHLGKFLVDKIVKHPRLQLAFVWNRNNNAFSGQIDPSYVLKKIEDFHERNPDLVIEVCHPEISKKYGEKFLLHCDYMMGSPTALADPELHQKLSRAAACNGLYIPAGAFWGGEDIKKMADAGTLKGLKVTMKKHPSSFVLHESLHEKNNAVTNSPVVLYEGPVLDLCPLAPNNVNTMAVAAIAAHNLGFTKVQGCLIADPSLINCHIVQIEVTGPGEDGNLFTVETIRRNPASPGAVTGNATYVSFFNSLIAAQDRGPGIHLC